MTEERCNAFVTNAESAGFCGFKKGHKGTHENELHEGIYPVGYGYQKKQSDDR